MSGVVYDDVVALLYLGICRETKECVDDVGASSRLARRSIVWPAGGGSSTEEESDMICRDA